VNHPQLTIDLLNTAHEMFRAAPAAAGRQIYHIGSLLAREHLALGENATAQRLLQSVAGADHDKLNVNDICCPHELQRVA